MALAKIFTFLVNFAYGSLEVVMAEVRVIESTCDRCHTQVTHQFAKKLPRATFDLPKGWLHVQGNTRTQMVFGMDLCEECKDIVMRAAGTFTVS